MARKDIFKGTLEALINPPDSPARPTSKSILHSAALGGVENGLARGLQLLDLDPDQISQSEFEDRMPYDESALADLIESMREHGQQIPILVQRASGSAFRVIYGRRRLAAARALGQKVRALVTQIDDDQRIIAQGIENSVRQDLSFIEKAMFAHRLREASVPDATIRAALNIDVGAPKATTISTMKMVVETLGEDLIQAIGRAPGVGRPRWRSLAEAFREHASEFAGANSEDPDAPDPSDERFKCAIGLVTKATKHGKPKNNPRSVISRDATIADVKASPSAFSVTVKAKNNPGFHAWLLANADDLLKAWHDQWQSELESKPKKEAR